MTVQEFTYYSDIAQKLFNYMNGKVNKINKACTFSVDPHDYVANTYGNIEYPNHITLFIGNIIDENMYGLARDTFIPTSIAWTICHELFHADQIISMPLYNRKGAYHDIKEAEVQQASYRWILDHENILSKLTGCNILIEVLTADNLEDDIDPYKRVDAKTFYLQTISNSIFRSIDLIKSVEIFMNDNLAKNIIADFNIEDQIMIKRNGKYIYENIPIFSSLVYKHAGRFNKYIVELNVDMVDNNQTAIAYFTISDRLISPVIFKK